MLARQLHQFWVQAALVEIEENLAAIGELVADAPGLLEQITSLLTVVLAQRLLLEGRELLDVVDADVGVVL